LDVGFVVVERHDGFPLLETDIRFFDARDFGKRVFDGDLFRRPRLWKARV